MGRSSPAGLVRACRSRNRGAAGASLHRRDLARLARGGQPLVCARSLGAHRPDTAGRDRVLIEAQRRPLAPSAQSQRGFRAPVDGRRSALPRRVRSAASVFRHEGRVGVADGASDLERLADYTARLRVAAVTRRLGWLLEHLGAPEAARARLAAQLPARGAEPLDPTRPRRGERNQKWGVIANLGST